MGVSIWHILVVVILVFLLFGAGRLPKIMEDLGKGIKNFKKGISEDDTAPPKQIETRKDDDKIH